MEIELNENVQGRLRAYFAQIQAIQAQINSDLNLIADMAGVNEASEIKLSEDLTKIIINE
jgi:hypothetical protein